MTDIIPLCPCINCITFPMCKVRVYEHLNNKREIQYKFISSSLTNYIIYQEVLYPKCSIIHDWVDIYCKEDLIMHMKVIGKLFLPKNLKDL